MKNNHISFFLVIGFLFLNSPVFTQTSNDEEVMLAFRYPATGAVYISSILNSKTNQTYLPIIELFNLFQVTYLPDVKNFTIRGNYLHPDNPFVITLIVDRTNNFHSRLRMIIGILKKINNYLRHIREISSDYALVECFRFDKSYMGL